MLDIQGYNIDRNDFLVTYGNPSPDSPIADTEVALGSTLIFDWTNGSGSIYSDLIVYDLGSSTTGPARGALGDPVYRAEDLSGSSHTVDPMEFNPLAGHQYQWHVASWNPLGVSFTTPETFVVDCPPDLTGDGTLDFFDTSAFLTAFEAQEPVADMTGDGFFDFFDIAAYMTAFSAGCP